MRKRLRNGQACLGVALALAAGLPAVPANAGDAPAYTLEECIRTGLERSRALANARREEKIAGATIRQVRAQVYPSLNLDGTYMRLGDPPQVADEAGVLGDGLSDSYTATLGAGQLLYSGGAVAAALRAAKYYRSYAGDDVARQENVLIRDITRLFHNILFARAAVDVAQESVKQLEDFEQQTRLRFQHETASEFDWLSAQVKLANERPRLVRASNDLAVARTAFRNLIYLDEEDFELAGELAYVPAETNLDLLYASGLENRPEVLQAQTMVRLRGEDVRVARSDYFPTVRAFANYQGSNPGQDDLAKDEWETSWNVGLTASLNLHDGGRRRATVLSKVLKQEQAAASLEDIKRGVRLEIENAYLALNNAREVVLGSEGSVKLAERALEIARTRYANGLATYLEFTDSNLALSSARLIHHEALRSYLVALAELRYACGTPDRPPEKKP